MTASTNEATNLPQGLVGLTSAEVAQRVAEGQINVNVNLETKSIKQVIFEHICTLFNAINACLALMVIFTGEWRNVMFMGVVICNMLIGIVQELRSKHMVDKLTLLTSVHAHVLRDGEIQQIDVDQIVLDDIIQLGRGDQIPSDAIVVAGDANINESLLTGESNLIRKTEGSELMSGSFVDSGRIYARVIHVGADNYVSKINNEAKYVKKVNSEILNSLNAIVRFATVVMIPLGFMLFYATYQDSGNISHAILTTVAALLGMIPQGLVLLTSTVLAISTMRLARRKVLAQQLYCIETLARVDVLCLDKTGTITTGAMSLSGTYPLEGVDADQFDRVLSSIAIATSEDANETCKALLSHYDKQSVKTYKTRRSVPFSSAKKWSGASFDEGSYVLGASQFVLSEDQFARHEELINELASSARALVVAQVDGFTDDGEMIGEARPLGFIAIADEVRASAAETIKYFCEQDVTLNVISGDDPRTVSKIAASVGIPGAEKFVDATTLDTPEKINRAAEMYHVFGRVTPQQKRELVQALKAHGHTVAMTGDGVNDVLALKEADCSVAMAAGSDAARNVSEIVLINNDFASMPAVVVEGRRSINNLQRSASLFLTKTLFSMALAAICIFVPPYPFQPIQMTLFEFFCIGAPSFVLALEINRQRVKGNFMANVLQKTIPASLTVVLTTVVVMLIAHLFHYTDTQFSTLCLMTTSTIGLALIWRLCHPWNILRRALFGFCSMGFTLGVVFFPNLFSLADMTFIVVAPMVSCCFLGLMLYVEFADILDHPDNHTSVLARRVESRFSRGVQVHMSRTQQRRVSSEKSWSAKTIDKLFRRITDTQQSMAVKKTARRAAKDLGLTIKHDPRAMLAAPEKTHHHDVAKSIKAHSISGSVGKTSGTPAQVEDNRSDTVVSKPEVVPAVMKPAAKVKKPATTTARRRMSKTDAGIHIDMSHTRSKRPSRPSDKA